MSNLFDLFNKRPIAGSSAAEPQRKRIIRGIGAEVLDELIENLLSGIGCLQIGAGVVKAVMQAEASNKTQRRRALVVAEAKVQATGHFRLGQAAAGNIVLANGVGAAAGTVWTIQHSGHLHRGENRALLHLDVWTVNNVDLSEEESKAISQDLAEAYDYHLRRVPELPKYKGTSTERLLRDMGELMQVRSVVEGEGQQPTCSLCKDPAAQAAGLRNVKRGEKRGDGNPHVSDTCIECSTLPGITSFVSERFCERCAAPCRDNMRQCEQGYGCRQQMCDYCKVQPSYGRHDGKWVCNGGACKLQAGLVEMCYYCGDQEGRKCHDGKWVCKGGACKRQAGLGGGCCVPGCGKDGTERCEWGKPGDKICQGIMCKVYRPGKV